MIFLAVAVEPSKNPKSPQEYKVWYLELGHEGRVQGIGVKSKDEILASLFESYKKTGKSNWRAFRKELDQSTPIELFDFVSMNMVENTHFGNLPTLNEFQAVLDSLQSKLELRSIAS
jgi:hypothetical protein